VRVQISIHKLPAIHLLQVDAHIAKFTEQLVDHRLQRVALVDAPIFRYGRPVGAHQYDRMVSDPAGDVKKQVQGGRVGPMQIFDHHEQRPPAGQRQQHAGDLIGQAGRDALACVGRPGAAPRPPAQAVQQPARLLPVPPVHCGSEVEGQGFHGQETAD
jgi:hypothetical protein